MAKKVKKNEVKAIEIPAVVEKALAAAEVETDGSKEDNTENYTLTLDYNFDNENEEDDELVDAAEIEIVREEAQIGEVNAEITGTVAIQNAVAEDMEAALVAMEEADEAIEAHNESMKITDEAKIAVDEKALAASTSRLQAFQTATVEVKNEGSEEVKKAAKKNQKKEEQKIRWLKNAKIDEDGCYFIVVEDDYKGYAEHLTWKPCFYIVKSNFTMVRVGLKFAVELAQNGNAKEMTKAQVSEAAKAFKLQTKAKDKSKETKNIAA